jgi:hypothetical protein
MFQRVENECVMKVRKCVSLVVVPESIERRVAGAGGPGPMKLAIE